MTLCYSETYSQLLVRLAINLDYTYGIWWNLSEDCFHENFVWLPIFFDTSDKAWAFLEDIADNYAEYEKISALRTLEFVVGKEKRAYCKGYCKGNAISLTNNYNKGEQVLRNLEDMFKNVS